MTPAQHYDAVVIGSGQGGSPLASVLAGSGRKTALVEREHVGGTCINWGCTPTKTMIASAKVAYLDHRSADYGVENGPVTIDMTKVRKRKREIVESFRDGGERRLRIAGVDLIPGEASFAAPRELEVRLSEGGTLRLTADNVFINVGRGARRRTHPQLHDGHGAGRGPRSPAGAGRRLRGP
jgi:pyruvate/2-oxoglutarate dehydrogenase complex dihydrolipoamide dehydrogenase (E3) component